LSLSHAIFSLDASSAAAGECGEGAAFGCEDSPARETGAGRKCARATFGALEPQFERARCRVANGEASFPRSHASGRRNRLTGAELDWRRSPNRPTGHLLG
jgi:hypothetical protein